MFKTVSITIGGMLFNVEEDAYRDLDAYLSAIRAHFKRYPDPDEIVSDIESRIAEEFSQLLSTRKKVVTKKDVADLITRMGTIEDFAQFDGEPADNSSQGEEKAEDKGWQMPQGRLYRDSDDQILGGVCAGIANYIGIDPTIMRLVFVVLTLINGFGVLLYIILWIILPEAKTPTEKVEMSRGRVTLSAIQQKVKQTVASEKSRGTARKAAAVPVLFVRRLLEAIGKILAVLFPVLARVIGFIIVLGCALAIAGITTTLVLLIVNPENTMVDLPLKDIVGNFNYHALLFSIYFLIFLPIVVILMVGASLLNLKSQFSTPGFMVLVALWSGALIVAGITGASVTPSVRATVERIQSEQVAMSSKTFTVKSFDTVAIDGLNRLVLEKSSDPSITVEAATRHMPGIDVFVDGETLRLKRKPFNERCFFFCTNPTAILTVKTPAIASVETDGLAHAEVMGFSGGELQFKVDGNSSVNADIHPKFLVVRGDGMGHLTLAGTAENGTFTFDGMSSLDGRAFRINAATVQSDGMSSIVLDVFDKLSAKTSGNSTVLYITRPDSLETEIDGLSSVGAENAGESIERE